MAEEFIRNDEEQTTKEKSFKIKVKSKDDFKPIADVKYISSKEFGSTITKIFKAAYADCVGCKIEPISNTNQLMISLYFDHNDHTNDPRPVACSLNNSVNSSKNSLVNEIRARHDRLEHGDKFFLTEEGKSGLADFLIDNQYLFDGQGEPKWGKIVSEVSEMEGNYYGAPRIPYTKVSFLDLSKFAELIFGTGDEVNHWVYLVNVKNSLPSPNAMFGGNPNANRNFVLEIQRISKEETENLATLYGFTFSSGLDIIR